MTEVDLPEKYCRGNLDGSITPKFFCSHEFFNDVSKARQLAITDEDDVLVLERGTGKILLLVDEDQDLFAERKVTVLHQDGLNHALLVHGDFIYASSPTTVFRWPKSLITEARTTGSVRQSAVDAGREVLVINMNNQVCTECGAPQGHSTRTLEVDEQNRLYITIGSQSNVDEDSFRSRMRRFPLDQVPAGGFEFNNGEVFADGMRNEVGIGFDRFGRLWGVENGGDELFREDLGGDIHDENPAEEINLFEDVVNGTEARRFYGYPLCFSEGYIDPEFGGEGLGAQWAWPDFLNQTIDWPGHYLDGTLVTDEFCKTEVIPPVKAIQSHSAPLGLKFASNSAFDPNETKLECFGGFPKAFQDDLFLSLHGSWNRDPPTGRKITRIEFGDDGLPTAADPFDLFCNGGSDVFYNSGLRPVDLFFDSCGRLFVSSDGSEESGTQRQYGSKVFVITYFGPEEVNKSEIFVDCKESNAPIPGLTQIVIAAIVIGVCAFIALLVGLSNFLMFKEPKLREEKEVEKEKSL